MNINNILFKLKELALIILISIKSEYSKSYLGVIWSIVKPALHTMIYLLIMKTIARLEIPNFLLFIGLNIALWNFIANNMLQATHFFSQNINILANKPVHYLSMQLIILCKNAYIFIINFAVVIILCLIFKVNINFKYFSLIIFYLPMFIFFCYTLIISIAMITPFVQDIKYIIDFSILPLMFLTPIIYPYETIANTTQKFLNNYFNPFYIMIKPIDDIIYYHQLPTWQVNLKMFLAVSLSAIFAFIIYKITRKKVIYYV